MIRRREATCCVAILLALAASPPCASAATMLTGEVRAVDSQPIETPPSDSSPVVLRYYLPEGSRVKPGDVIVRIDPGNMTSQLRDIRSQIEQAQARADKEVAELRVKAVEAQIAQVDAQAALDTATVDASIPQRVLSALDYDRYHGERDRAQHELALKVKELAAAREAVARRSADATLEIEHLKLAADYYGSQIQLAEVRADRAGVVLHAFDSESDSGGRIDEGGSSYPGRKIGEVVGDSPMAVRAWAFESERSALAVGQGVDLVFDAFPGRHVPGRITAIAGAPEAKSEWGRGHYFQVDIALAAAMPLTLRPGMSVRVDAGAARALASGAKR